MPRSRDKTLPAPQKSSSCLPSFLFPQRYYCPDFGVFEAHINGITQHILLCDWLLPLNTVTCLISLHSTDDGHSRYFRIVAALNKAEEKHLVHIFPQTHACISVGPMPRSEIAGFGVSICPVSVRQRQTVVVPNMVPAAAVFWEFRLLHVLTITRYFLWFLF